MRLHRIDVSTMPAKPFFFLTFLLLLLTACSSPVESLISTGDLSELGNKAATEIIQLATTREPFFLEPTPLTNSGFCDPGGYFQTGFLAIGYLPEYRPFDVSSANCLSDVIFFSLEPTDDGALDTTRITPERIAELQEAKRLYNVRIHLALGGWGRNGGFSSVVIDPAKRNRFVTELVTFMNGNGFDGVDFDWEFPETADEKAGYAALITETKQALLPQGGIVSVTFYPNPELDLSPYLAADRIQLMSYDRDTRHATFDQAVSDIELFLNLGVPAEKLVLGLPFYGRTVEPPYTPYTYAEISNQYNPAITEDEVGGIFYNGPTTIQKKTCHALHSNLAGVMAWEIGQDLQPNSKYADASLLRALYQAISKNCEE